MKLNQLLKGVIFQNANYLVVNKPAGISVLADRSGDLGILELLRLKYPEIQACHRIDKETSGALLFSFKPEAYRHASIQFQNRTVKKVYHALVKGRPEFNEYSERRRILVSEKQSYININGKDSATLFNTLAIYQQHSLIECIPETGRMHQIRVHLQVNECPIVADSLYGGEPFFLSQIKKKFNIGKYEEEKPVMGRLALHAFSIAFKDLDGSNITVEAPYSKDMSVAIKQMEKYSRN